jgi:hypothetical protein
LVRIATLRPAGTGWFARIVATLKSSSMVSVRITPAWRKSASTATSPAASAPVCEDAARVPAVVRPDFTAAIGLRRPTRRASRPNFRGFPKDSRYSRITSVSSSASQYCRRSLPEMSALFPTLAKLESPSPRRPAAARIASPSAPDCEENATRPGGGKTCEKVPFMRTSPAAFKTPMQLGPIMRMPWSRTVRISASSRSAPASPASEKLAEMTTATFTPRRADSCTTSST